MSVTSANINDLGNFVDGSQSSIGRLSSSGQTTASKCNTVTAACSFQHPNTPSINAVSKLLQMWSDNQRFVREIRKDLIEANNYDAKGNATVSDAVVRQSLLRAGLTKAPNAVTVPAIEMLGEAPYSGFRNDPISMANGNFLLREGDLELFGIAAPLSVVRSYNSRDTGVGIFGPGWTALADVSLTVQDGLVTYRGQDGGGAVFQLQDNGTWVGGRRRNLSLAKTESGWLLTRGHLESWTFDELGLLVGLRSVAARVAVTREPGEVRFADRTSGRWVSYSIDTLTGLATKVESSDGRIATYGYDDEAHLVLVRRDAGDTTYEYEEAGFISAVTDADGVVTCRNTYDEIGRVLTQVDHRGRETTYDYRPDGVSVDTATDGSPPNVMVHDQRGRLTAMIDGLGNTMRLSYDDDDNIVQIVDRLGSVTLFEYDDRGNLLVRTDPDGLAQSFSWDEHDRLVAETSRSGYSTTFEYEGDLRDPSVIILSDGSTVHLTYARDTGLPLSVTDSDDVTFSFEWNTDGLIRTVTDGLGGTLGFEYDPAGRTTSATRPESVRASVELDDSGNVVALNTADGRLGFQYTAAGRPTGGTRYDGSAWATRLDLASDVTGVSDGLGVLEDLELDSIGRVISTRTATGGRWLYEYDPVGRPQAELDPFGGRTQISFDGNGQAKAVEDPSGRVWSYEYDEMNQMVAATSPSGATTSLSYHPNGRVRTVTDPAGHTWRTDLDQVGRISAVVDPEGNTTSYAYTPGGRLVEVRSPLGRTVRAEYDSAGRLSRVVEADGTEVVFERRRDGSIARVTSNGVTTSLTYDNAGRVSAVDGQWGAFLSKREFGEISSISRSGVEPATFERNERGLVTKTTDPAGVTTEFTYDSSDLIVAHTTGDATTSFSWDLAGRLRSTRDAYGNETEFARDARGVIERVIYADGTTETYLFDENGEVSGIADSGGAMLLSLARDIAGNLVSATTPNAQISLSRNSIGRVTQVATEAGTIHYSHDADGYLTGLNDGAGYKVSIDHGDVSQPTTFLLGNGIRIEAPVDPDLTRDEGGRIIVDENDRRYSYDLAGRLASTTIAGQTTRYEYNDLGLLSTEHTPLGVRTYSYGLAGELLRQVFEDGTETVFEYDVLGRRTIEHNSDGSSTRYEWDGLGRVSAVLRFNTDGSEVEHQITHDPLGRPARIGDTPVLWDRAVTGNLLGIGDERYLWWGNHVRVATDPDSAWDRRVTDDPWGVDGEQGLRLGYRGELALDDLLFLGARVYDARSRSFLSRDPLPSQPGAVTFAGVYSYAWCDPVNMIDPSGEHPISDEDYDTYRKQASKGLFDRIADDPWKYVKKAAIVVGSVAAMAAASAFLGPVGLVIAGAIVGGLAGGLNTAVDGGSAGDIARSAIIGAVFGAASAGFGTMVGSSSATTLTGRLLGNTGRNALVEYPLAAVQEAAESYLPGTNNVNIRDGKFDLVNVLVGGTSGSVSGAIGAEVDLRRNLNHLNQMTGPDLLAVKGIGPTTSKNIVDYRASNGNFSSLDDVLDVKYIGPVRRTELQKHVFTETRLNLPVIGRR